tara:strand:+ start:2282 stop:2905 length:624 start_codon:yes stop_codon:yes gene_type:complete
MTGTPILSIAARTAAALSFAAMLGLSLQGCVSTVVGAGAMAGTAAMEERGLAGAADDTAIRLRINALLSDKDERLWRKVGLQVYLGRVLLTGTLETPEMRAEAVRLVWQAEGVKEVINEIQLVGADDSSGFARDTWISTQLKSALLFDKEVASINYSIETVRGTVYLIGLAQDKRELDRVINHARGLSYVKKVVNYVRIKRPPANPS